MSRDLRYDSNQLGQRVDLQNAQVMELLQRLLQRSGVLRGICGGETRKKLEEIVVTAVLFSLFLFP